MYTLYKFHFLNGISEIHQFFDDILIIWPAPVCVYIYIVGINILVIIYMQVLHYKDEIAYNFIICTHMHVHISEKNMLSLYILNIYIQYKLYEYKYIHGNI